MKFKMYNKIALLCAICILLFCLTLLTLGVVNRSFLMACSGTSLLVIGGGAICLISLFSLLLIHYLVSRPLIELADQAALFDPSKTYTPIQVSKKSRRIKDEIDLFVSNFTEMQKRVCSDFRSLKQNVQQTFLQEKDLLIKAVDHVPLVVIIADKNNRIQYANIGAEILSGYKRSELVGRNITMFPQSLASTKVTLNKIEEEIADGKQWEGVIEWLSKSGKPLTLFSIVSPVFDSEKNITNIISVSREISYELGLQDELMNARKMEALGRLSSNFAHEFGNPLFGIRSVITDFYNREDTSNGDKELLAMARDECDRMREMVKEFQQLYQDYSAVEQIHNIHRIIETVVDDINPIIEAGRVEVLLKFADYDPRIRLDKGGLSLVLKNIIVNGVESMEGKGGVLCITTEVGGNYFYIMLEDSGPGIKGKHQELVFEPFFSTKPAVEGAGLGLSVAFATMKRLGGSITFESKEGEGTLFTVHVPLSLHNQKTA